MALIVTRRAAPAALTRTRFWLYALTLGVVRADVLGMIDTLESSAAIPADLAARLRIKVNDAAEYDRLDPDLLLMTTALGVASTQAELDTHFAAAMRA